VKVGTFLRTGRNAFTAYQSSLLRTGQVLERWNHSNDASKEVNNVKNVVVVEAARFPIRLSLATPSTMHLAT
jgi:hypothetical protein